MHCPVCGFENLLGAEVCDNCGADTGGHDVPQPALSFQGRLLGERKASYQVPYPRLEGTIWIFVDERPRR